MNVEDLLIEEKQKRLAQDGPGTSKLCREVLTYFKEKGDWDAVIEHLILLSKKRGQHKVAITGMVNLVISWMEQTTDMDLKYRLIKDLCDFTEGKITVEVERARVVRTHARLLETDGKIEEAARLLQEVQVETYGSMDRRERVEYILDQMRLVLAINDYVRCQIVSKKLSVKFLNEEDLADIKVRYYNYMTRYHEFNDDRLNLAKAYKSILEVKEEVVQKELPAGVNHDVIFGAYVLALLTSPFSKEQQQLLAALNTDATYRLLVQKLPVIERLLDVFNGGEIISRPVLKATHPTESAALIAHPFFAKGGALNLPSSATVTGRYETFESRVVEHNIRIISKSFSKITLKRFASLLNLSVDEAESVVSSLVVNKNVAALIDRPDGVVLFSSKQSHVAIANGEDADLTANDVNATPAAMLDEWVDGVHQILEMIEETGHLINKERMLAVVRQH